MFLFHFVSYACISHLILADDTRLFSYLDLFSMGTNGRTRTRNIVHGPEATFSEIGTTRRDKGSYAFFDRSMYVDNEMR